MASERSILFLAVALLPHLAAAAATPLGAQGVSLGVAAGVAVPTGPLGANRSPGPVAQASVYLGGFGRRVRGRVDVEAAWFPGGGQPPGRLASSDEGDLRVSGVLASLVVGPRGGPVRPYALVGAGAQGLSVPGRTNPYGAVPGVRAGVGVRATVWGLRLHAELVPHAILSDYGTGRDFEIGTYWPITVGVRF